MILNPANSAARAVTLFCILTCIYLSLYLSVLFYTDSIYKIGKFNSFPLILAIALAEIAKFILSFFFTDISFASKASKVKKYYLKLKLKEIFKCAYLLTGSTGVFYVLAVLFGAPVLSECEETLMFAVLITTLAIFPPCLHLGADNTVTMVAGARQLASTTADLMLKNLRLTLLGAWAGAIVIPLDWDRPWQVWPIPCCTGAILGFAASHLLVLVKCIPLPNFLSKIGIK